MAFPTVPVGSHANSQNVYTIQSPLTTPYINAGDLITMDVHPQVSDLASESSAQTGVVINTASVASRVGVPDMAPYCASKAGVMSLTRSMALALAEYDITVNALAPGIVDTDMWVQIDDARSTAAGIAKGESMRKRISSIPLGRAATPEDIANVAAFLASSDSDYITGQTFNIDGGARPT